MRNWVKMILCLLIVWGFIRFAPLLLGKLKSYQNIVEKSEELGIDNSALFYSEEPLTSVAEQELAVKLSAPDK